MSTINATDLTIVNRSGVDYKVTAADVRAKAVSTGIVKAWANIDGTVTLAKVRASLNVSSIVESTRGQIKVNFVTAMQDANYAAMVIMGASGNFNLQYAVMHLSTRLGPITPPTTTSFNFCGVSSGNTNQTSAYFYVTVCR